jgi:predicted ribosomally synthesized peptide with nif11-like leader
MPINKNELTREQLEKAMQCKTAEELMKAAKAEGYDVTKDEAEAYMAEMADVELDEETLTKAAGGGCYNLGCESRCDSRRVPPHQAVH